MKLYNRNEISAILKKATQNSSNNETENLEGLSIEELHQLAKEVGINPDQIEKAIAEIDAESIQGESNFWGGPFTYNNQVLINSEISASEWEEMLITIRDFFQSKGEVTTRDSVYEWSSPWGTTNTAHVTALKNNGKTKISVGWNGPLTAIPFYIPVPLVAIASLFFGSEFLELTAVPGITFTLLATGLSFLVGRWGLRKHLDKGFKKLHKMLVGLEKIASKEILKSVSDADQTNESQEFSKTNEPLLKIDEEITKIELDIKKSNLNRSRT